MKLKWVKIIICEACLNGEGEECHTPECALFLHSVDLPIHPEMYEVIDEWEESDNTQSTQPCSPDREPDKQG